MKSIQQIANIVGILIVASGFNISLAEQIQVGTTFSCSTNAECKRKCEALGSDHVWKPNPGGSTLGTCTKKLAYSTDRNMIELPSATRVFIEANNADEIFEKFLSAYRIELMKIKKVEQWDKDNTGDFSVPLTIGECEALGGTVQYHPGCGSTLLKCSNRGYAACITELAKK
jgi:hypothetical protein